MFWISLLVWAITTVLAELIRPKPNFENARPSSLGDFNFPSATEGRAVPLIWGRVKVSGPNVVWYGNFRKRARTENVKTGMFSSEDVIIGYRYFVGMQFALCRGPVLGMTRLWINDKPRNFAVSGQSRTTLYWPGLFGGEEHGNGGVQGVVGFYDGGLNQTEDTNYLTNHQSPLPAYRSTCYVVWEGGWVGNSAQIAPWAFEIERYPDGLNMAAADPGAETPNTTDCNPMNVVYEILTDTSWGLGISPGEIDVPNFQAAASILFAEGNGWAMVLDNEMQVTELLNEVQRQINGTLFFNRGTGQWQVALARGDYDAGTLDTFDETNITELSEFTRQTWHETTNIVRVAFVDSGDEYKSTYALAQNAANINIQGVSVTANVNYPGVQNKDLANDLAWRDLLVLSFPLAKVTFKVDRTAFALIPGSVFKFGWARLGISDVVFRVGKINYGKPGDSKISIFAIQDIFATSSGVYSAPVGSGWIEPSDVAVALIADDTLVVEAPRQLVVQDPRAPLQNPRIWMTGRFPGGGTISFQSHIKADTSRPIGPDYSVDTGFGAFAIVGILDGALTDYGSTAARPDTSYSIDVDELDELDVILIDGDETPIAQLLTVAYVGGEYIGFEKAEDLGGGTFRLSRIWRGLFHTAPKAHADLTRIWFMGQGGALSRISLTAAEDELDTQLRSQDNEGELTEGATLIEATTLLGLWQMPLAPRDPVVQGVFAPSTESLDDQYPTELSPATGDDASAVEIEVTPRDWEVDNVTLDDTLGSSWSDFDPEFDFTLVLDPDGADYTAGPVNVSGTETPIAYVLRNDIILAVGANNAIPSTGRIIVTAKHDVGSVVTNPVDMTFDLAITSSLQSDDLNFGAVPTGGSAVVVAGEDGDYTFDIQTGKALPSSGTLEGRINGGSWVEIVGIGSTSGDLTGVSDGDDIEVRTTQAPDTDQFFDVTGPTSETGFGVLTS